jgi:hypothetical protein
MMKIKQPLKLDRDRKYLITQFGKTKIAYFERRGSGDNWVFKPTRGRYPIFVPDADLASSVKEAPVKQTTKTHAMRPGENRTYCYFCNPNGGDFDDLGRQFFPPKGEKPTCLICRRGVEKTDLGERSRK